MTMSSFLRLQQPEVLAISLIGLGILVSTPLASKTVLSTTFSPTTVMILSSSITTATSESTATTAFTSTSA